MIVRSAQERFLLNPPFSEAPFVVNAEPHTEACPSVRLCVGLVGLVVLSYTRKAVELELERIQTQMAQKPMRREEVSVRARVKTDLSYEHLYGPSPLYSLGSESRHASPTGMLGKFLIEIGQPIKQQHTATRTAARATLTFISVGRTLALDLFKYASESWRKTSAIVRFSIG
jgi:hypothetical protein